MTAKDARPGKYKPKCGKCGEPFSLTVHADARQSPLVEKLSTSEAPLSQRTVAELATSNVNETIATAAPLPPVANSATATRADGVPATWERTTPGSIEATMAPMQTVVERASDVTQPGLAQDRTRADLPAAAAAPSLNLPEVLGGYKLVRELGRGAMGAVYLAKQLSLDRNVALKVIQAQWAQNPAFVARFTREAYAAAQLTHHNVVQIYDLGSQGDINFFSMEFVSGESLAERVQKLGKLDAEEAVGYVLQAARGLNFAHQHGMVHRDVKPANLMLNEHGVVKVADLGLVKTPQLLDEPALEGNASSGPAGPGSSLAAATADVTLANIAMGTPAYMAPEQSENAAGVDHRADIYSLGCTLYVLLTGRPPFEGASALEVITKHRTEPIVRPDVLVKRISPQLSEIVLKMVAKLPDDRYQSIPEVIGALEGYMGIKSSGLFSPEEGDAQVLEASTNAFNNAPLTRLRSLIPLAFVAGWLGLFVLLFLMGLALSWAWWLAGVVGAAGALAIASYFVVGGLHDRTYLFDRVRAYLWSLRWTDGLTALASTLVALPILWLFGWLTPFIVGSVLGVGLGVAYFYAVDKPLAASRREPLAQMEALLKSMRMRGVDEATLQQFVVKYSGDHWEEFFEKLFGYEAKLRAREELAKTEQGRRKPQFRPWRGWVINSIEKKLRIDREHRDRQHLQKVEEAGLKAQGIATEQARREAALMADALVDEAADVREQKPAAASGRPVDPKIVAAAKRSKQLQMLAEARGGKQASKRSPIGAGLVTGPLGFALSGKVRFLAGICLLAAFVFWLRENGVSAPMTTESVDTAKQQANDLLTAIKNVVTVDTPKPLAVPVLGPLLSSLGAGIAGLILVTLGIFRGWKMSIFAWPAALVAIFMPGPLGYGIAAGVAVVGLFLGRTQND